MGTTVIAILRTGNKLALAHIGDSRGYLLRDGTLTQITHDHTFVQSLRRRGPDHRGGGRAPPAALPGHPGPDRRARTTSRTCRCARRSPGDRYLLCSDGLTDVVAARHHRPRSSPRASAPPPRAERLIDLALRAGASDNVTVHRRRRRRPRDRGRAPPPPRRWSAPRPTAAHHATAGDTDQPGGEGRGPVPHRRRRGPGGRRRGRARRERPVVDAADLAAPYRPARPDPGRARRRRATRRTPGRQRQYFVGAAGDGRDLPGRVPGHRALAAVPRQHRDRRHAGRPARLLAASASTRTMSQSSAAEADALVTDLRTAALVCQSQTASGRPCGSALDHPVAHLTVEHRHALDPPQHAESPDHPRAHEATERHPHVMTTVTSFRPAHPPQRRAAAAAAGRRHRAARLRSTSVWR